MSTVYKLFIEVIKLFLPKLDFGSMVVGLILKLIFAAITASVLIGGGVYIKNKYNDWKHSEERADNAEKRTAEVIDVNKGLSDDIGKTKESGQVDVSVVVDNAKAADDINKKTDDILKGLDQDSKDIAAGKNPKPRSQKKPPTSKTANSSPATQAEPVRTQSHVNIDAMWASYCTHGGEPVACANNS